jgi:hypothetical protein
MSRAEEVIVGWCLSYLTSRGYFASPQEGRAWAKSQTSVLAAFRTARKERSR